jgi:hypothetical protein
LIEVEVVETFWRGKLRTFWNRVLAVPSRVRNLTAQQSEIIRASEGADRACG